MSQPTDERGTAGPFGTGWYVAAGFVILVVLGLVVALLPDHVAGASPAIPAAAGAAAAETGSTDPSAAGSAPTNQPDAGKPTDTTCPASDAVTDGLVTAPPDGVTWQLAGGVTFPLHPELGPTRLEPAPACYQHSPAGAVLAASAVPMLIQSIDRDTTISARFTPGPVRDAALRSSRAGVLAQPAGFRVLSYNGTHAVVSLALRFQSGQLAQVPVQMIWTDNDWYVDGDPSGGELPGGTLSDLDGFVRWTVM